MTTTMQEADRQSTKVINNQTALTLDSKSKLLKSAIYVFSKYGFLSSSLRQIADRAGQNHGAIRYHFKNKEALWQACVSFLFDQLKKTHIIEDEIWKKLTTKEKLEHRTRSYLRFSSKYPELFRIITFETLQEGSRLDWIVTHFLKPYAVNSVAQIERAQRDGLFPSDIEAINIHYLFTSANRTLFLQATEAQKVFGVDIFSEDKIQQHEDAVIKFLLRS